MTSKFEIVSHKVVDTAGERKHVVYTILLSNSGEAAGGAVVLNRRYTDFLDLYRRIRQDHPNLISHIFFPKKVFLGNFAANVILSRKSRFQDFLGMITNNERLRGSDAMITFLTRQEETQAMNLLRQQCYKLAKPLFVNIFMLVNKFYTEKHPTVIIALCRLVACCNADVTAAPETEKYAQLALRRFESMSDIDLLRFYIPLLHLSLSLYTCLGKDKERSLVEARLDSLRRQGHRVDGCPSLLQALLDDRNV